MEWISNDVLGQVLKMAIDEPELPPRELAIKFNDECFYFVLEDGVYRLLKA